MATIGQIKAICSSMWNDPIARKISVLVSGPPGVGKTSLFEQIAEEKKARLAIFLAATMDPTDVVGCPHPIAKGDTSGITQFFPPEDLFALTDNPSVPKHLQGPTIACFDDITAAYDQVFAALYRFFQQRQVAGENIRDNVFLCATGNRAQDKAAARDLPTALNNRFWHVDFDLDPQAWREWAIQTGICKELVGYIGARPDKLHDQNFAENNERAFATPRTVEMVNSMINAVGLVQNESDLGFRAVAGCVGEAWAVEFMAYLRNSERLVPPLEIIKAPKTCKVPDRADIDVIHATISTLTYHLIKNPSVKGCKASMTYAMRLPHKEMGMVLCRDVLKGVVLKVEDNPEKKFVAAEFKAQVTDSAEVHEILEKYGKYL